MAMAVLIIVVVVAAAVAGVLVLVLVLLVLLLIVPVLVLRLLLGMPVLVLRLLLGVPMLVLRLLGGLLIERSLESRHGLLLGDLSHRLENLRAAAPHTSHVVDRTRVSVSFAGHACLEHELWLAEQADHALDRRACSTEPR